MDCRSIGEWLEAAEVIDRIAKPLHRVASAHRDPTSR